MQSFLKSGKLDNNTPVDKSTPSSSNTAKQKKPVPWVEKYRPRTVSDVVEQRDVVNVLQQSIEGADLPNMLLYGPPGTGKTSTILAAARQLFGNISRERILELNASDERGIQVIREKVKSFSQLTASNTRPDGTPCPAFKIVILDEADSMTHAAQAALRRTMEKETKTTRFCLICNYVSRIIEPLTSRCTKFRFKPIANEMVFERLRFICDQENVQCDDDTLDALVSASGGDMRRAITCLQSCARLKINEPISKENVFEVTGIVPDFWIKDFVAACKEQNPDKLKAFVKKYLLELYPGTQFLEQFADFLIASDFTDKQKAIIGEKLGLVSYRLNDGAPEYPQLLDLGVSIITSLD